MCSAVTRLSSFESICVLCNDCGLEFAERTPCDGPNELLMVTFPTHEIQIYVQQINYKLGNVNENYTKTI